MTLLLLACSNISALLSQGCFPSPSQLCRSLLCFSAIPAPSLTSLPATCLKRSSEQENKSKLKTVKAIFLEAGICIYNCIVTSNLWHH